MRSTSRERARLPAASPVDVALPFTRHSRECGNPDASSGFGRRHVERRSLDSRLCGNDVFFGSAKSRATPKARWDAAIEHKLLPDRISPRWGFLLFRGRFPGLRPGLSTLAPSV